MDPVTRAGLFWGGAGDPHVGGAVDLLSRMTFCPGPHSCLVLRSLILFLVTAGAGEELLFSRFIFTEDIIVGGRES